MYYFISFTLVVILSKVPQKFIWNSNMFFLFLSFCRSILLLLSWLLCSFLFSLFPPPPPSLLLLFLGLIWSVTCSVQTVLMNQKWVTCGSQRSDLGHICLQHKCSPCCGTNSRGHLCFSAIKGTKKNIQNQNPSPGAGVCPQNSEIPLTAHAHDSKFHTKT